MRILRAGSVALALAALAPAAGSGAVEVPFVEDFTNNVRAWENAFNAPLTHEDTGGPDDSSYATTAFNFNGFSSPFGAGPVIFRASASDDASGGAFEGNWVNHGVQELRLWVRQDTGLDLVYFARFADAFNFPGVVIDDDVSVPSGVWTQISFTIDPIDPTCQEEGITCAQMLRGVGNLQFGTNAPAPLPTTDQAFNFDIDQVELTEQVPEPGQAVLLAIGALAMVGARKLRRAD